MDTVYILQVVTICVTALTLVINVLVTLLTNKQKNYNEIITNSRLEFMVSNRNNATKFIAEAKSIALMLKSGSTVIDVKPLYTYFEQIRIALKTYNAIDKEIVCAGNLIVSLVEQSVLNGQPEEGLTESIEEFSKLFNIYDDADWKFIKQQFNSTNRKSEDFDKICSEIKSRYQN